jgi:O-antigen/teichoic acid export membrane protein
LLSKSASGGGNLDRRQFLRHFMIILTGNGAAQAVNLLSYPVLARLYSPEAFGTFAMFVAATAIPSAIACGRFDLQVPTAPGPGRFGIFWLCLAIASIVGILSIGGAAIYWQYSDIRADSSVPFLVGLAVFLTGACSAMSMFLMRHDWYRTQSLSVLTRTGGAVIVQIALGLLAATSFSLITGFVAGLAAQALLLAAVVWRRLNPGPPRKRGMRAMFSRFRPQVAVDIPSTLIAAFSLNLLTFLLAALYGQRTVGFYAVGNRLAIVPLALFNDALSQTFHQKAARAKETKGHFWDEMKFSLLASALLSIAVLAGIVLLAKPFIMIYLGKQWAPAADMLIILAPMLAVRSLAMSIGTTVFVMRAAHWLLIHNIANVLTTLAAYGIAALLDLSSLKFLMVASAMLTIEYALFATFLIFKARSARAAVLI